METPLNYKKVDKVKEIIICNFFGKATFSY